MPPPRPTLFREHYRYSAPGCRAVKTHAQRGRAAQVSRQQVRYLPGLEMRTAHHAGRETENLRVVTLSGVRILRWLLGRPEAVRNGQRRFSVADRTGSSLLELDGAGNVISREQHYPSGGTALWTTRNQTQARYKTLRYSGKERDMTGLMHYGWRYYAPWLMRWINPDPAGTVDGLNLFSMVRNNAVTLNDTDGRMPGDDKYGLKLWHLPDYQKLVHAVENKESDLFQRPATEVINEWKTPLSTSLIDSSLITDQNPYYNGLCSPVGFIINAAPQNILSASSENINSNMRVEGNTTLREYMMQKIISGTPLDTPLPSPDEILKNRYEGRSVMNVIKPLRILNLAISQNEMHSEVLVATQTGVKTYREAPVTQPLKIEGIIMIPKAGLQCSARTSYETFTDYRVPSNTDLLVLDELRQVNPDLPEYVVRQGRLDRVR